MRRLSLVSVALLIVACGPRPRANVDTVEVRGFLNPVYVSDTAVGLRVVEAALAAARAGAPAGTAETLETGDLPFVRVSLLVPETVGEGEIDQAVVVPGAGGGLRLFVRKGADPTWRILDAPAAAGAAFLPPVEAATGVSLAAAFAADDAARAAVRSALDLLFEQEGLEADRVVSLEAAEWPDSSLGCPEEGRMYAQVVTPGHRVVLETGGGTYDVRLARDGGGHICP